MSRTTTVFCDLCGTPIREGEVSCGVEIEIRGMLSQARYNFRPSDCCEPCALWLKKTIEDRRTAPRDEVMP